MENLFAPKFDPCNDCQLAVEVNNCFNNDPRFFTIKVAYSKDLLVFQKKSVLVNCKEDTCQLPDKRNVPPAPTAKVIIRGYYLHESEFNNPDAKMQYTQIELLPGETIVVGNAITEFDELCQWLQSIVTDCSCECK